MFVVSTGNSTSVKIRDVEDIRHVRFIPNDSNINFFYGKIENFIPSGDRDNVLDIKLKNYSSRVSVIIDVGEFLHDGGVSSIMSVDDVELKYDKPSALSLLYDSTSGYDRSYIPIPIKGTSFLNNGKQYKIDFQDIFLHYHCNKESTFKAHIQLVGRDFVSTIGVDLNLSIGYRHTFVIKPKVCGAYMGQNNTNFREFMCRDLGYIDQPSFGMNTYSYAWGRKANVYKHNGNPYESGDIWKEEENPCPIGYRVPTIYEWRTVLDERNNVRRKKYKKKNTWDYELLGFEIGNRLNLYGYYGQIPYGFSPWIWSSTVDDVITAYRGFAIRVLDDSIEEGARNKDYRQLVRCIKKLPNE